MLKNGQWLDLTAAVFASGPSCCAMACCTGYGKAPSSVVKMYEHGMPSAQGSKVAGAANNAADAVNHHRQYLSLTLFFFRSSEETGACS